MCYNIWTFGLRWYFFVERVPNYKHSSERALGSSNKSSDIRKKMINQ